MAHVRKEGNSWYYAIDFGRDANGKRKIKKKRGFKTEKEAKIAMTKVMNDVYNGDYIETKKLLYKDLLIEFLADKEVKVKNSTFKVYSNYVNHHIIPELGHKEVQDITSLEIQMYIRRLIKNQTLSDENINKVYTLINNSLDYAIKFGLLRKNPCKAVDRPKIRENELDVWNWDEVSTFLEVAKTDRSYCCFLIPLTTGLRQSETLGLTWDNVDLENGIIKVRKQLERGTHNFTTLKTKKSKRDVNIPDFVVEELKKQKQLIKEEKDILGDEYVDLNLVCPTSKGTPYLHSNLNKIFKRLIKKSELKSIRYHDLRHSFCSMLIEQGANIKEIAVIMGHSSVRTTLDIYGHLHDKTQKNTAKQFGDRLFGAKK